MEKVSIVILDPSTPTWEETCFCLKGSWEWGWMQGLVKPGKKYITFLNAPVYVLLELFKLEIAVDVSNKTEALLDTVWKKKGGKKEKGEKTN